MNMRLQILVLVNTTNDLEGFLQDADGEVLDGVGGEPETVVWVRLGDPLQRLLQLLQPLDQQVAVLQHQPLAPGYSGFQQLQRHLQNMPGLRSQGSRDSLYIFKPQIHYLKYI